jgi:hypothetical protein
MGRGGMPAEADPPQHTLPLALRGTVPLALVLLTLVGVYVDHPLPPPQDDSVLTFSENRARGTPTTLGRHRRLSFPQPTIRSAACGEEAVARRAGGSDACMTRICVQRRLRGVHRRSAALLFERRIWWAGRRPTRRLARQRRARLAGCTCVSVSPRWIPGVRHASVCARSDGMPMRIWGGGGGLAGHAAFLEALGPKPTGSEAERDAFRYVLNHVQSAQASAARRGGLQVDVVQAALSGQWDLKVRTGSSTAAPTLWCHGCSQGSDGAHPATALAKRRTIEFVPCVPFPTPARASQRHSLTPVSPDAPPSEDVCPQQRWQRDSPSTESHAH